MPSTHESASGCPVTFPARRDNPYAPSDAYPPGGHGDGPMRVTLAYGGPAWLVTGYHETRRLLADDRLLSADATTEGFPQVPLSYRDPRPGVFVGMDPPEHDRLRHTLTREFNAAAVEARRPAVTTHVDRLLTEFIARGPGGDLVADFSDRLPRHVSADLFGVPGDDTTFIEQCRRARATHDGSAARRHAAGEQMRRVISDLVATKIAEPTDDLLGRTVTSSVRTGRITAEELVGMATLLLAASLEATSCLISLTVLALLRDEQQGALVRENPDRWIRPAIDESLRFWTVIQHGPIRIALTDIQVGDRTIRAGDAVVLHLHSANWDRRVYDDPEVFDLRRTRAPHLSFGHGTHRCLGAGLGQLEASIAIGQIFGRLPWLRPAVPMEELSFRENHDLLYGVKSLPVIW